MGSGGLAPLVPVLELGTAALLGTAVLVVLGLATLRWWRSRDQRREIAFVRSVIHSIPAGVSVAGSDGKILVANTAAKRLLGGTPRNVPQDEWSRAYGLFAPDTTTHFPADQLPLARAIRGEEVTDVEVFVRNRNAPDGAWVSVSAVPLRNGGNRVSGGVTVFRDITAHKLADELSRRLFSAVEQTTDCVFITDRDGTIEYVNPAFETTTGYGRAEAIGQTPRLLKSGKQVPGYYEELWATVRRGECFKATVVNRKKSGELFHAEQTITPIRDDSTGQVSHYVSLLRDMTHHIRLTEQEAEMRVGASVQQKLFPQRDPEVDGYDIAGLVAPALATCGDYYDFIASPDGRLLLVVADVCGHGVGAALIMASTRAYLHSFASTQIRLEETLPRLNALLLDDLEDRRFVTMILALLDVGSGKLEWANMGHPAGFVLDAGGAVKARLASTRRPFGLFHDVDPPRRPCAPGSPGLPALPLGNAGASVALDPGDLLVLLTDGVIETTSPDDREFGIEALLDTVRANRGRPSKEIAQRVLDAVRAFSHAQPQEDDMTIVVCRRADVPGRDQAS